MKTRIFEYKGNLGAETDMEYGVFINDIKKPGQLGCVIDVKEIEISKEAKELLKNATREGGSFSSVMLTKHTGEGTAHGEASIGLMGFQKHHFGKNVSIGRDCSLEVLDLIEDSIVEAPEEYKTFIDTKECDH